LVLVFKGAGILPSFGFWFGTYVIRIIRMKRSICWLFILVKYKYGSEVSTGKGLFLLCVCIHL